MSESKPSSSTWPTGDGTTATFGTRTSSLAPLVSSGRPHDLHGDTPGEVDASTSSFLALSRQKRGRSGVAVASLLWRARARSSLHRCPPKLAHSSGVTRSPTSTRKFAVKPSDEPTFLTSPKSGRRDLLLRWTQCWAPWSISSPLVRF